MRGELTEKADVYSFGVVPWLLSKSSLGGVTQASSRTNKLPPYLIGLSFGIKILVKQKDLGI